MFLPHLNIQPALAFVAVAALLSSSPCLRAGSVTVAGGGGNAFTGATSITEGAPLTLAGGTLDGTGTTGDSSHSNYFFFPGALLSGYAGLSTITAAIHAAGLPTSPLQLTSSTPGGMPYSGALTINTTGGNLASGHTVVTTGSSTLVTTVNGTAPTGATGGILPFGSSTSTGVTFAGNVGTVPNYSGAITLNGSIGHGTSSTGTVTLTGNTGGSTSTGIGSGTLTISGGGTSINSNGTLTLTGNTGTGAVTITDGGALTVTGSAATTVATSTGAGLSITSTSVPATTLTGSTINLGAGSLVLAHGTPGVSTTLSLTSLAALPLNVVATINASDPGTAFTDTNTVDGISGAGAAFPAGSSIKITSATTLPASPTAGVRVLYGISGVIFNRTGADLLITPSTDEPGGLLITQPQAAQPPP